MFSAWQRPDAYADPAAPAASSDAAPTHVDTPTKRKADEDAKRRLIMRTGVTDSGARTNIRGLPSVMPMQLPKILEAQRKDTLQHTTGGQHFVRALTDADIQ